MEIENVTAIAEGNVYFDGKVVSHTIMTADGAKKTLGVIMPGEYHFDTVAPERMEIISGSCQVVISGTNESDTYEKGTSFDVPADSGFTITVSSRPCHYVCSFL